MNMKNCQLLPEDQVSFSEVVLTSPYLNTSNGCNAYDLFHPARKRQMDSAKEVEKEIQTEEVKRRRGRVYGRQETEQQKEEDPVTKSSKIHLSISSKYINILYDILGRTYCA